MCVSGMCMSELECEVEEQSTGQRGVCEESFWDKINEEEVSLMHCVLPRAMTWWSVIWAAQTYLCSSLTRTYLGILVDP